MAGIYSPDVRNLSVGKGFATFTPEGGTTFHLGNCPKIVYTPRVTVLPHFSSMAGTKVQDFSVITQKGGEVAVDMEEMTGNNLALFFLGLFDGSSINIFGELQQIRGRLQFQATNDVGPRWAFDLTRVLISPQGNFNPISDGYNTVTVTMTHVIDDTGLFGTINLLPAISNVAPTNVYAPFISGPLNPADVPVYAQVGEILSCNIGGWVGVTSYSFQWNSGGNPQSGATNAQYTVQAEDAGQTLTCTVTGHNSIGDTPITTAATAAVHA